MHFLDAVNILALPPIVVIKFIVVGCCGDFGTGKPGEW
jgi:hypothetical protein